MRNFSSNRIVNPQNRVVYSLVVVFLFATSEDLTWRHKSSVAEQIGVIYMANTEVTTTLSYSTVVAFAVFFVP